MTVSHDRHENAGADVLAVAVSPNGGAAVSLGRDGKVRFFDPTTGTERAAKTHATVLYAGAAAYSPDGRAIAVGGANLWVLDGRTHKRLHVLKRPGREPVHSLAFSPSGGRLATTGAASRAFPSPPLRVWDVATGGLLEERTLEGFGSTASGRDVCWTDDDTVVVHADNRLGVLHLASGGLAHLCSASSSFRAVAAVGGMVAHQGVSALHLVSPVGAAGRDLPLASPLPGRPNCRCLAVSPSGRRVAAGISVYAKDAVPNHAFVVVYDLEAGAEETRFELMSTEVNAIAWVDESDLLTGDNDGELHRWSAGDVLC